MDKVTHHQLFPTAETGILLDLMFLDNGESNLGKTRMAIRLDLSKCWMQSIKFSLFTDVDTGYAVVMEILNK